MIVLNALYSSVCSMSFGIGSCLLLISFAKDIRDDLQSICDSIKSKESRAKILDRLKIFIEFHITVKKLSSHDLVSWSFIDKFIYLIHSAHRDFAKIYRIVFFILNFWSLATVCSALLVIKMEMVQHILFLNKLQINSTMNNFLVLIFLVAKYN